MQRTMLALASCIKQLAGGTGCCVGGRQQGWCCGIPHRREQVRQPASGTTGVSRRIVKPGGELAMSADPPGRSRVTDAGASFP
jgi:hypothetical protein